MGGWVGGWGEWVYGMIIIPLRGPSCKLRFARIQLGWISRWAECGNKKLLQVGAILWNSMHRLKSIILFELYYLNCIYTWQCPLVKCCAMSFKDCSDCSWAGRCRWSRKSRRGAMRFIQHQLGNFTFMLCYRKRKLIATEIYILGISWRFRRFYSK